MRDPKIGKLFDDAAEQLLAEHRSIKRARMFASDGLKTADKFFGFVGKNALIVKLSAKRVAQLIDKGTGQPCDVGRGPMKEWVCLQPASVAKCKSHLLEAFEFVKSTSIPGRKRPSV